MKKKLFLLLFALCGLTTFFACSSDDDDDLTNVPQEFSTALQTKFPSVNLSKVKWELKSQYRVAEFKENLKEVEVWFNPKAEWAMTSTDYGKDLFMVPTVVNDAFLASQFSDWTIDDIDYYERPDTDFYVIEVEKRGFNDMELYFAPDGTMIKAIEESNMEITPDTPV